ncbi:MAG: hypothetical protein COA50_16400 [Flavobacteriaceae bacterium]|nr:MAG: hypothetical protein COA50_16400 [Flavobacteriaceae bacterium]
MPMQKIGKMSLKNSGGFVTRVYFTYLDDDGNKIMTTKNNGDLLLGQTQTIDPATLGVPDGSMVYLYAFVVWGTDNEAKRAFIYEKGNANIANWVITGTTLNNDLGLTNISS